MAVETQGHAIAAEHVDVIIVGAGISGIGSAYGLQQNCPEKTYLVLEGKGTFGGTWDTHKYPGVRSDSDLYADSNEVFEELKANIRAFAGEDFPIEPHFVPKYKVWQQRIAFCPNGDVFQAAAAGKVSVGTDCGLK